MNEYVIFIGAAILGAVTSMAVMMLVFKKGIAIRMNAIICTLCVIFAIAGFILGKMGVTIINTGLTLIILLPLAIFQV